MTDGDANITTIQRDVNGVPTAIQSPFGQDTTLTLDANGNLASITNPEGETTAFTYTSGGLLTGVKNPACEGFEGRCKEVKVMVVEVHATWSPT